MEKKYKIGMYINIVLTIISLLVVLAPFFGVETEKMGPAPDMQIQTEVAEEAMPELPANGGPENDAYGEYATIIAYIGMIVLIAYYAIKGYKKPHGNLLRWTMLAFALSEIFLLSAKMNRDSVNAVYPQAFVILCVAYMAGRLNKIEKNKYIAVLVLLLLVYVVITADIIGMQLSIIGTLASFTPVVIWIDICGAYFTRFAEHKEAGLEDAPNK